MSKFKKIYNYVSDKEIKSQKKKKLLLKGAKERERIRYINKLCAQGSITPAERIIMMAKT